MQHRDIAFTGDIENTTINVLLDAHNTTRSGNNSKSSDTNNVKVVLSNIKKATNTKFSINIDNLSFESKYLGYLHKVRQFGRQYKFLRSIVNRFIPENDNDITSILKANFKINSGSLTAILGADGSGREVLTRLMADRVRYGTIEGDINIQGDDISTEYSDNVAFVPKEFVYMTGLSYEETLRYAAMLRMTRELQSMKSSLNKKEFSILWQQTINQRVDKILTIMNLQHCRSNRIPDNPTTRGIGGGELRRLSIAVEIIHLPPIIIIDDPALGLETTIAVEIFQTLKVLASDGHAVICSMLRPSPRVFNLFDEVVLMSQGFSIYAGSTTEASKFFSSSTLGYERKDGVELVDFLIDISSGNERSAKKREAIAPIVLQNTFEISQLFDQPLLSKSAVSIIPLTSKRPCCPNVDPLDILWLRTKASISRALVVKSRDIAIIKKSIGSSFIAGLFTGYLQYGQGDIGYFSLSLLKLPYAITANATALLFFSSGFTFSQQVINVHIICQRLLVFRYEQAAKCCPTISFMIAFLISEIPFVLLSTTIFASITFGLGKLAYGFGNYMFFLESLWSIAFIGLIVATLYASVLGHEYSVRELYIASTFFMLLISGFPFQLKVMTAFYQGLSVLNPVKWSFQCLMSWKFGPQTSNILDGSDYLLTFFDTVIGKDELFVALSVIIVILATFLFYSLLPYRSFLKRKESFRLVNRDSVASDVGSEDGKLSISFRSTSELHKPLIYTKQSSVSSKSKLSISVSQTGEYMKASGQTIAFKNIDYYVKELKGERHVLQDVSGQFDWGKLSAIMGGVGSGKSSLLHVLAGDKKRRSRVSGSILIDNKPIDPTMPLWQRCAFVDNTDEFHANLTVEEIITLAMQLRCFNSKGLRVVAENVESTIKILMLESSRKKMAKHLTPGERRLLSIAEEIVNGPSIVLIDEALTGLDSYDTTTLLSVFRELVNEDRTVVASLHQPSAEAFSVFDSLILLSQGRIIYWGPSDNAINFFNNSPLGFDFSLYNNPVDFITDISSCTIHGKSLFADDLRKNFEMTEIGIKNYRNLDKYFSTIEKSNRIGDPEADAAKFVSLSQPNASRDNICNSSLKLVTMKLKVLLTYDFWEQVFFKKRFLFVRAWRALLNRTGLIALTISLHIGLALLFYSIVGVVGYNQATIYNCTSFFAVSTMLILFMNLIYVQFLDLSHRIFLKESDRQLYTNFDNWSVSWIPMSCLVILCAVIFSGMSSRLLVLNKETKYYNAEGTYILITVLSSWAGEQMSECIVNIVPHMRAAYILIPTIVFLQFSLSGLFLKFQSLHHWLAWAPATSIIRWTLQADFINNYEKNRMTAEYSPTFYLSLPFDFTAFKGVLQLFSWNTLSGSSTNAYNLSQDDDDIRSINDDALDYEKTVHYHQKWFCISILFILVIMYRLLSFVCSGISSQSHKGGRFQNPEAN